MLLLENKVMAEKRTKIIYCITKANWGGAQRYVYDLATSLSSDKYNVSVLAGTTGTLTEKLRQAGIKVTILRNLTRDVNIWKDVLVFIKLVKIFRQEKPDIIHLNSSKMGDLGAVAGKLAQVRKIIFTGHGWAFNEDRSAWQKKIIYFFHWLTISLTDNTIAVSEQTKTQLLMKGKNEKKIVVLKNGLEEITYLEKLEARKKILTRLPVELETESKIWLGTISELHKNKGLKYLIEAIHLLDTAGDEKATLPIVIIIGEGENREKLQTRINRYNLQSNVFLIGQVDQAARYLKAFDIFTLTSITEALPYAILEAGQAGLPIIASAVGGIPEIITDMKNGVLVKPKEPEEIVKAVNFFLKNPDKMALFGDNLQKKIRQDFNKEKMIEDTVSLYHR